MTENLNVCASWEGPHDSGLSFHCLGCDDTHQIRLHPNGWGWNGDKVKPTFTPSVKVTYPANPKASDDFKEWRTERICHSFVTNGKIQYLDDCAHALAGQTIDLPIWTKGDPW